jgi:serine/threonine protein kinase
MKLITITGIERVNYSNHRDLTPSNILIGSPSRRALICDLRFAQCSSVSSIDATSWHSSAQHPKCMMVLNVMVALTFFGLDHRVDFWPAGRSFRIPKSEFAPFGKG